MNSRREIRSRNIGRDVISIEMIFKAMKFNEFIQGMDVEGENRHKK